MTEAPDVGSGLRDLEFRPGYDSSEDLLRLFYIPALSASTTYNRSVGYFRSSAFSIAARGLSRFIRGGGRVRLLVGAEVQERDRDALIGALEIPDDFAERLQAELVPADEIAARRLEVLGWLARQGRLFVRVAISVDASGRPVVSAGAGTPYFHEKIGVLRDARGDGVAFQGSVNESAQAWAHNFESFSVYRSWDETASYFEFWARKFEEHWAGRVAGFRVYDLPEAVRERLLTLAPESEPPPEDPEEASPHAPDSMVARYLQVAPKLIGAERLAEETTGVKLFPHQRQVVERLASQYPRSWLVADEVGLGKTISAGVALRRLLLSGEVKRALILAPASVCRQWQDELFEKFGLWVDRLEGRKLFGAHPDEIEDVPPGSNPYAVRDLLIGSSHLARMERNRQLVVQAGPFDLVVIDEAHHARRQGFADPNRYRPSRLLRLLDAMSANGTARALWLLTATPMQVNPIELMDLLSHVGLTGELEEWETFRRYHAELAREDEPDWNWLASVAHRIRPVLGPAESRIREDISEDIGPVGLARIERFQQWDANPAQLASELGEEGRSDLRRWLRQIGPVGQFVTRHGRRTLRHYRDRGLLDEPLADRDVRPELIEFREEERQLYDQLDAMLDRLTEAHGRRRGAGLLLTVYRRRLTSSWAAIRSTLSRRLREEGFVLEEEFFEEAEDEDLDTGTGGQVDDRSAVPLSASDRHEIEEYLRALSHVRDSKFDQLERDIDNARSTGQALIVFTQFADTMEYLRDRLRAGYGAELATFSGSGGRILREGHWVEIPKRDLVDGLRVRRLTILLATDAASEGLNLQACSFLVNYDMPWNPMRVEQRIGRIDRIGQPVPVITVRNYFIPDTVEERVYNALAARIDDFTDLLGNLQPILGATERAFREIFRAPRAERVAVENNQLKQLGGSIDELREGGIDVEAEDPLPVPVFDPAPVTLRGLEQRLVGQLGITLRKPHRPATFDPERVSRDEQNWAALASYGHPDLAPELADRVDADEGAVVIEEEEASAVALRADRTPPEPITTVDELDELGGSVSTEEARRLAREMLDDSAGARTIRQELAVAIRTRAARDDLRQEFIELVRRVIAARCALAEADGKSLEPISVWLDLGREQATGWAYAEAFRDRLGIGLGELVDSSIRDVPRGRSREELNETVTSSSGRLRELTERWQRLHELEPAGGRDLGRAS